MTIKLSVHELVDFLLRKGDIDDRIFNISTMNEGTRIHLNYQSIQAGNYISEYYLKQKFKYKNYTIELEGRADGVIVENKIYTIDEIKSTIEELDSFYEKEGEWHLGQAICYAYMIALEKGLESVNIVLTYIHQISKQIKKFYFSYDIEELEDYVYDLFNQYVSFYELIEEHQYKRNESMNNFPFPFESFRKGQRELSKYAYKIAMNGGRLFVEAPTGIGKTMSTIYPFIISFGKSNNEKIFYLTAKSSGKEAAKKALNIINEKGGNISNIDITAKDKICPNLGKGCNPDECEYARGYYSKLKEVVEECLTKEKLSFSYEDLKEISEKYKMCPFEFSLDLSMYLDFIICDYNYFFDPLVHFQRYFDNDSSHYLALVDEGHNLVERGRNMYSASISYEDFLKVKKHIYQLENSKIRKATKRLSKHLRIFEIYEDGERVLKNGISIELTKAIDNFLLQSLDFLKNEHEKVNQNFLDFYFNLKRFYRLLEYYDETFSLYISKNPYNFKINLFCLDPSKHLNKSLKLIKSSIIFSATFNPISYYLEMIHGDRNVPYLELNSPFNSNNLKLMIAPKISTKYSKRDETISEIIELIKVVVSKKIGNYIVYVPSYEYLSKIRPYLEDIEDIDLLVQEKDMLEVEKEQFISLFTSSPIKTTLGLAILGGTFSEGIDLVNDRLIGVIIIGVGLPQICFERNLIKNYFYTKKQSKQGFDFAYTFPGMNKVTQAVGRVIRTPNDYGVALLIDDRYLNKNYRSLFKKEWDNYEVVTSKEDVSMVLDKFYNNFK